MLNCVQSRQGRVKSDSLIQETAHELCRQADAERDFHHFTDPNLAASECRRVLRERGSVFFRTGTREQVPGYPYVPFFPSTRSMLEELLPTNARVREVLEAAGLHMVASETIAQIIAPNCMAYAEKLSAGGIHFSQD
jgi:hypothetical protein